MTINPSISLASLLGRCFIVLAGRDRSLFLTLYPKFSIVNVNSTLTGLLNQEGGKDRIMIKQRVVVTGMGAVTPIGIGVPAYWDNLVKGTCGVAGITRFDPQGLPVSIAAEVKDFVATDFLSKKLARETDVFMHYALVAAEEALQDSHLALENTRIGIVMGTSLSGAATIAETQREQDARNGEWKVSPRFVPKVLGNIAASQIAISHRLQGGPSLTINTACSSGADAIGVASMLIQMGEADVMLAVGSESILCALMVAGLSQARALSTNNTNPQKASRPFDLHRDGFVIGEGGGALILETEEHAKKRGARIYAELLGYDSNTDGYHVTSPSPDGGGAISCMQRALHKAGLSPENVDYVNAHGTATKVGDEVETLALKRVFGEYAANLAISSTKGATGHLMGAGGITEVIACIQAIQTGVIPPTLNYETPDPACDLYYVPNQAIHREVTAAMSNALGFGGQNASILMGKYKE